MTTTNLKIRFNELILADYIYMLDRYRLNSAGTRRLLGNHASPLEMVKALLRTRHVQIGFYDCYRLGEGERTFERRALQPEFSELFTDVELSEAQRRVNAMAAMV